MNINDKAMKQLEKISGEKLTLSGFLRSIREGEEMSQAAFAQILGVSRQYVCDIERGRRSVSPKAAYEYAQKLGFSAEQFVRLALQDELDNDHIPYRVEILYVA